MKTGRRLWINTGIRAAGAALASAAFALVGQRALAQVAAPDGRTPLPAPASWRDALARSSRDRRPLVVLFSVPGCPWCRALRRDVLNFLLEQADERGVTLFELDMTDSRRFSDDSGDSPASVARALRIKVSPTVVFIGASGELAERLIGYPSPDFYNAYLDQRIDQARARLDTR